MGITFEDMKEMQGELRHIFVTHVTKDDEGNALIFFNVVEEDLQLTAEIQKGSYV